MLAEVLAFAAPVLNATSALLTGPLLVYLWLRCNLDRQAAAQRAEPWQQAGWMVLFVAQATLAGFGLASGYAGLQLGPVLMILVAGLNYWVWRQLMLMVPTTPAPVANSRPSAELDTVLRIANRAVTALNHYSPAEAGRLRDEIRAARFAAEGI